MYLMPQVCFLQNPLFYLSFLSLSQKETVAKRNGFFLFTDA